MLGIGLRAGRRRKRVESVAVREGFVPAHKLRFDFSNSFRSSREQLRPMGDTLSTCGACLRSQGAAARRVASGGRRDVCARVWIRAAEGQCGGGRAAAARDEARALAELDKGASLDRDVELRKVGEHPVD